MHVNICFKYIYFINKVKKKKSLKLTPLSLVCEISNIIAIKVLHIYWNQTWISY